MRKVVAGLFSSLDGVVEAPNEWHPRRPPDQVRTGRSPADKQWRTDRDLPADPIAPCACELRLGHWNRGVFPPWRLGAGSWRSLGTQPLTDPHNTRQVVRVVYYAGYGR